MLVEIIEEHADASRRAHIASKHTFNNRSRVLSDAIERDH